MAATVITPVATPWWKLPKMRGAGNVRIAGEVWRRVDNIRNRRRAQNLDDLIYEAIYMGRPLSASSSMAARGTATARDQRSAPFSTLNVTQAKVDALTAALPPRK